MSGNSFPTHVQTASTIPLWPWLTPLLALKRETLRFSAWAAMSVVTGAGDVLPSNRGQQSGRVGSASPGHHLHLPLLGALLLSLPLMSPSFHRCGCLSSPTEHRVLCWAQILILSLQKKNQKVLPLLQFEWGHAALWIPAALFCFIYLDESSAGRVAGRPCWGSQDYL